MRTLRCSLVLSAASLLTLTVASATAQSPAGASARPASPRGETTMRDGFDAAFRFASALDVDRKDKMAAQEAIVLEIGLYRSLDDAIRLADRIDGWRRGVAYAELAGMAVRKGRADVGKALLARAETIRAQTKDWGGPRIASHMAQVAALLGDTSNTETLAGRLSSTDRQYLGRPTAVVAASLAARGRYDEAMQKLAALDPERDDDIGWWRTAGYVDVAKTGSLTPGQRRAALVKARASSKDVRGWRRADALTPVADAYRDMGDKAAALEVLKEVETIVLEQSAQALPVKGPLMAALARSFHRLGAGRRARELVALAERYVVPQALNIEQPGIYADLAATSFALGDKANSERLYDKAFGLAEGLINARPRALQVVEICRSMGREGVPLSTAYRSRLEALLADLKDPW